MTEKHRKARPLQAPAQKRRARSQSRWRLTPTVIIVASLAIVAGFVIYAVWQTIHSRSLAAEPIEGIEEFPNLPGGHQEGKLTYDPIPPAGGVHNPAWQNCGVYSEPIANENAVHSLEHGAIWITYRPDLPAAEVERLQEITRQSRYRLLSPYPDLPSPIVVSAWGYQLKLQQADDPRLARFIQKYERNPLGPEPNAPCTGGVGQPG